MPSATYDLVRTAMAERLQIQCGYGGYLRQLCPIILGYSRGEERALTSQFGGSSSSLPPGGEWRCLWLSRVTDIELRAGPWRAGSSHQQPQGCVEVVDFDVNPAGPYNPKNRF